MKNKNHPSETLPIDNDCQTGLPLFSGGVFYMEKEEIWKDIVGYEGLYQISNLGRCYSVRKNLILKSFDNGHGYLFYSLHKGKKMQQFYVHRLISLHFILNQDNKKFVNHINGIKSDNRMENLEWCTGSENLLHSYKTLKLIRKDIGSHLKNNYKKVILSDNDGNIINRFESLREASVMLNINYTNLSQYINGSRKTKLNIRYENKST